MNTLKYVGRPETLGRTRNRCEQQGGCLIWQGATRNGHPTVYVGRQPWVGQRLVYALTHEEPAPYRRVGNTCGNPLCLNPKHLRLAEQVQRLPRAVQQQRAREKGGAESFGCVLAVLRVQKAVSMSRLGQKTGINHSYISRIEAGDRHPTRPVVLSFADALNCSPAERDRLLLAAGYAPLVVDEVPELRAFLEEAAGLPVDVLRESLQRARGVAA